MREAREAIGELLDALEDWLDGRDVARGASDLPARAHAYRDEQEERAERMQSGAEERIMGALGDLLRLLEEL